jgi:hypothetical protein
MAQCNEKNINNMLKFFAAPCDEEIVSLDCNDFCEQIPTLAERVANGENLADILPELENHIQYYKDCREEFEALVELIKAEKSGALETFTPPTDGE